MSPNKVYLFAICLLGIMKTSVKTYEIPFVSLTPVGHRHVTPYANIVKPLKQPLSYPKTSKCYMNWIGCSVTPSSAVVNILPKSSNIINNLNLRQRYQGGSNSNPYTNTIHTESNVPVPEEPSLYSRLSSMTTKFNVLPQNVNSVNTNLISLPKNNYEINMKIEKSSHAIFPIQNITDSALKPASGAGNSNQQPTAKFLGTELQLPLQDNRNIFLFENFTHALDRLERKFYSATFAKLISITPTERNENGMSFVQSGILLHLALLGFSTEADFYTKAEIVECLGWNASNTDTIEIIKQVVSSLPKSSDDLKFRWSSRLLLWPGAEVSQGFREGAALALHVQLDRFNGTETPDMIASTMNRMVEIDSGGAIHNTFDEDELSEGVHAVFLTTLYMRGLWRSAPTVLNGSNLFRDDGPPRSVRMIRINDIMRYADLTELDAEAVEIFYATQGLSLLMLVPRGRSLRRLAEYVASTSITSITQRMQSIRMAATLPLYTLRMTLLLPNKLQAMGVSRLVDVNTTESGSLRLSHAVQRIMFWAEAGRNAFKDDGIEWDNPPELELVVDRPYIFFVRWHDHTLMNGNFVL